MGQLLGSDKVQTVFSFLMLPLVARKINLKLSLTKSSAKPILTTLLCQTPVEFSFPSFQSNKEKRKGKQKRTHTRPKKFPLPFSSIFLDAKRGSRTK